MNSVFKTITHECDFCVVGGGLAGTIAALSAARLGLKVVLIQDRPVLGGNASSEIRMWVRGAAGAYNRETGILAEMEEENIYRNPTLVPSVWDSVLFGIIKENSQITLLLNTSCLDAECHDDMIFSVTAWQLTTYSWHTVRARYFADCSGDSILAPLSGAKHRIGREAYSEYQEKMGKETADTKTMGMSLLLQARETDHPVPYIPPHWANVYETDEDFAIIPYLKGQHSTFRGHTIGTSGSNLWWMELGGDGEAIANTEQTRDELLKVAFGIWDHMKNRDDHGYTNWELEWVGFLPGKRESVRYIGEYVLTQNDIEANRIFDDVVAYGGWPMDDHNPLGMKANDIDSEPSMMYPVNSPYHIPYRCLYSSNIQNLFFAGRNISATHAAISSTRVMGTCSLLGQAMGTAAAFCAKENLLPKELKGEWIPKLQRQLMDDGVFLPGLKREVSAWTQQADINISLQQRTVLLNGMDRPQSSEENNYIELDKGQVLRFSFEEPIAISQIRLQFDLDYSRLSVSPNAKMRRFAQKLHTGLDFVPMKVAETIVKSFAVYADDTLVFETDCNYHSLIKIPIQAKASCFTLVCRETWGSEKVHLFSCDLLP